MKFIYVNTYGARVRADSEIILIEKDGEKSYISPRKGEVLIMGGGGSVSAGAIKVMAEHGMTFIIEDRGEIIAYMESPDFPYSTLESQMEMSPAWKMEIAREMIISSARNRIEVLRKHGIKSDMKARIDRIRNSLSSEELMGAEGDFTREYFSHFRSLLKKELGFERREKHPPRDPVNSMLSYGYAILASKAIYAIKANGISPRYGVLHATYRNKTPMVYDFMEEFRGPIVDMAVLKMAKKAKMEDFTVEKDFCFIKEDFRKGLVESVFERLFAEMDYYGKKLALMDIMMYQAKVLKEAIEGREEYRGFRYA